MSVSELNFFDTAGKEQRMHVVVPDDTALGGMLVLFRILLAADASASHDVIMQYKTRIIDAWVALKGDGTAGSTVTFQYAGNAITNALDCYNSDAVDDRDIVRAGEIKDGYHEIPANGVLRVATASTGGDFPGAEAYALGIRVA